MRRGRRPWLALIAVVLTIGLDVAGGACLPLLARDPRVTEGASASASFALPIRSHADSMTSGVPLPDPLVAGLSYGWAPNLDRYPAVELTVKAPFGAIFLPEPEAYVQMPRSITGRFDAGAGATYSWMTNNAIPYVALGLLDREGTGPVMLAAYSNRAYPWYGRTEDRGRVVTATLGYQFSNTRGPMQLFLEGVFARRDPSCDMTLNCLPSTRSWLAAIGVSQGVSFTHHQ
jgi:hypothetical protein